MIRPFQPFMLGPLTLALSVLTLPVSAEQATGPIETIVVRGAYFGQALAEGVKTPTLLLNVPQSVSVMDAQQLREQAHRSVADVMQYTPGVSIGQGEDHRDQLTIRGQNTTADFFLDGLRDDVQYFRPLYNLERVEVLRGANALLFGRGGGGGVVNRVSKVPTAAEAFTTLSANFDSFGAEGLSLDVNQPLGAQGAFRLNALADGDMKNHRDYKDGERLALNPTVSWLTKDGTLLNASYEWLDDDRVVDRGVPSMDGAPLGSARDTFFADPSVNRTTFGGHIARLRAERSFGANWRVNATLQYANYNKYYRNQYPVAFAEAGPTVTLDGYADSTDRQNTLFQLNAVGTFATGPVEHTMLAGVEQGLQESENARRDALFATSNDDQVSFAFTDPLVVPAMTYTDPVRDRASEVQFTSAFLQDELSLGEHLILVVGLRLDRFSIEVKDRVGGFALSAEDTELSPRLGVIVKPWESVSAYASYSESFLPRSGDQFLSLSLDAQALDPEVFENREVGLKWQPTERLALAAAAFEIERDNGVAVDPANPERSVLTGTKTRGWELQLDGSLTEWWSLNAGYSHLAGRELGRFANGLPANRDLAQLPEDMLSLWSRFIVTPRLGFGVGVVHQAEQFASLSNAVTLPAFTRVDLAAFFEVSDKLSLQLNVENLFDEHYFPAAHNDNNITTGEPRYGRLALQYRF